MAKRYTQLTIKERYWLERLIQDKCSNIEIAKKLGRATSTIGREIKRNSKMRKSYSSDQANELALERCKRELPSKFTEIAKDKICEQLKIGSTPEQISANLKHEGIISVSHELIYQYINNDRKSGGNLYKLLPRRGNKYKKRNIKNSSKIWKKAARRISISERCPKEILKSKIGNWEGDIVEGKGHRGGLATFVDMKSKYVIIKKVRDKSSEEMKNVLLDSFASCPELIETLTVDNGNEFARHDEISSSLNTKVYFANPYSPWERGLNENTNGLIRRFYPKGTDFHKINERKLLKVQDILNNRPRKTLGFKTPKQVFTKAIRKNEKYASMLSGV